MIKRFLLNTLQSAGYRVIHRTVFDDWLAEQIRKRLFSNPDAAGERTLDILADVDFMTIYEKCRNYTQTSLERMYALYKAVNYIADAGLPGDLVECGVWRGGSMMLCAYTLAKRGVVNKRIYMYDTYQGMPEPTDVDVDLRNKSARDEWQAGQSEGSTPWNFVPQQEVEANLAETGYPEERFVFVAGRVEDTIPGTLPREIALLRLDTDFFASTMHEMTHLFPLLVKTGVLIIDDYGHWKGQQVAVDKYFNEADLRILLCRIDHAGRIAVKT